MQQHLRLRQHGLIFYGKPFPERITLHQAYIRLLRMLIGPISRKSYLNLPPKDLHTKATGAPASANASDVLNTATHSVSARGTSSSCCWAPTLEPALPAVQPPQFLGQLGASQAPQGDLRSANLKPPLQILETNHPQRDLSTNQRTCLPILYVPLSSSLPPQLLRTWMPPTFIVRSSRHYWAPECRTVCIPNWK